jgi:hypothetical protein
MENLRNCFVCGGVIEIDTISYNKKTNLPVCAKCKGSEAEVKAEKEALDSLSEGFVCGCI